jgi:hypothetical protein
MQHKFLISYTVQGMVVLNRIVETTTIVEAISTVFEEYEGKQVIILNALKVG